MCKTSMLKITKIKINRGRDMTQSQTEKFSSFKMSILPKLINRFTRIPTKIPKDFLEIETSIVKFILKCKKHTKRRMAKTIMKKTKGG